MATSSASAAARPKANNRLHVARVGNKLIAVGLPVTRQPPHSSRRAVFPHRALREYSLPQQD